MYKSILYAIAGLLPTVFSLTPTIYVYAYSWTPGFCAGQTYPGCANPLPYWGTHFTIHGLWPQYATTGYPASCDSEPFDETIPQQIGESTMVQYWPNVQAEPGSSSYTSFWAHEWTKHGTCTHLTQLQYFETAIQLTQEIPTPDILIESVGKNMSASVLRESLGGLDYVALQCDHQTLTGAYTCWNQTDNLPTLQIPCPPSVVKEDTCMESDDIRILSIS
jgi:ribonuclease T2